MKKVLCDKASRKHTYIMVLSITMVVFLILVNIASVASSEDIKNSGSNNAFNFNKFDKAISAYDKAIEINLQNSPTLYNHAFFCSPINKTGNISVHILAINDFHGHLEPSNDTVGAEYLATYIKRFKSENPNTIVVSAGDNIGASPLISAHFHDEPTIKALSMMGFDFSAVGNHELDKGLDELMRIQYGGCHPDGCLGTSSFEGAHFQYLAANIVNNSTNNDLVFPAYAVTYVQGVPIGFIGIALESTPTIVSKFAVKGLKFLNETEIINKYVKELKDNKGVKTIVVLIHNGGYSQDRASLNNTQLDHKDSNSMHISDVVKNTDRSVAVFITGHTHQAYNELVDGRNVTEAYAYGNVLTDIDMVISNETHDVIEKEARNIIVSRDVPKDSGVAGLVMRYKFLVAPIADKVIGSIKGNFTAEPNDANESTLGDLIADAQLNYTHADVAFTNPEGFRSDLNLSGSELPSNVTYGQAFSVQPFGNNLVTMNLTGTQIKNLLEQQFDNTSLGDKEKLQVSNGFNYTWNKSAPVGERVNISGIKINGTSIDPNRPYRVTVDSFMAGGGNNLSVLEDGLYKTESELDDVNVTANYLNHSSPVTPVLRDRITVVK